MSMTPFDAKQMEIDMGLCPVCHDHMPCGCNNGLDDYLCEGQSDELDPAEYENLLAFVSGEFDNSPRSECPKCGESITAFEITINHGKCPCCSFLIAGCETCEDMKCGNDCPAPIVDQPRLAVCESCRELYEYDDMDAELNRWCCEKCGRSEDR